MGAEVEIDLNQVTRHEGLHELLAQRLNFPDYYGRNWDAFWDVVTSAPMPARLVLIGWAALESRLPREASILRQCLDDLGKEQPGAVDVEYC